MSNKATAVKKYGLGFMNAINYGAIPKELIDYLMRGGGIPQFNSGGAVGMSNQALTQPQRGLPPQTLKPLLFLRGIAFNYKARRIKYNH
ncbi:hypothetical protein [Vibrio phage J14]|nr:hypothetical protein [Vibrio phage J14]